MENKSSPKVYYAQSIYGREEIDAVVDVLENDSLALMGGRRVLEFEKNVSNLFGKNFGCMVNSGSSANLLALSILGLPPGSEIITPALTFSTTVAPIVQNQLKPVFVDVESNTFLIDYNQIEDKISNLTSGMMVPNLIGNIADWKRLKSIADKHNLILIEDSADTIGYTLCGDNSGKLSDVTTTSFYASHIITGAGFGGMVMVNDRELIDKAALLRGWGRRSSRKSESENINERFLSTVDGVEYDDKFIFDELGYNFLPSEISAAFGHVQLEKLGENIKKREQNFIRLYDYFNSHKDWFILPQQTDYTTTAWLAMPLIVRQEAPFTRRELQIHFEENNIQTRTIFTGNVLRQPGFASLIDKNDTLSFPNADEVMRGGFLIGCHHGLTEEDLNYVFSQFDDFSQKY